MPLRLRPREARFTDRFCDLGAHLVTGSHLLAEVLGADLAARPDLAERMREVDQQAEEATHAVLRELAAAFVTPFDRVDVYRLAWAMRLCSRSVDAACEQIALFGLERVPAGLTDQVVLVGRAADLVLEAMPRLGRVTTMTQTWTEVTRLAKQSGEAHRRFLVSHTAAAGEDPVGFQRGLLAEAGVREAVAAYEGVAHVLEQIVVKEG